MSKPEKLDGIGAWLRHRLPGLLAESRVPGAAVAVCAGGEVVEAAAGVLSTATGVEATVDSLFQIGSVTKVLTATLVMQLVDEGRLDLDAPVRVRLPEFRIADERAAERITVRQLMCHVAGFEGDVFTDTGKGDDCLEKYLDALYEVPQLFAPGEMFSYNNAGYCVLGRIVEVVRGKPFDACVREHLFAPLGLTHAANDPYEAIVHRTAVGHVERAPGAGLELLVAGFGRVEGEGLGGEDLRGDLPVARVAEGLLVGVAGLFRRCCSGCKSSCSCRTLTWRAGEAIWIGVTRKSAGVECPGSGGWSNRVHGSYLRFPADLPSAGRRVVLRLRVRRFTCAGTSCGRQTFVEQVPGLTRRHAQRTERLRAALAEVGFALAGRAGARLADVFGISVSRSTVLRLVDAMPDPQPSSPRVVGIDEYAMRKGRIYGTVLVDIETRRPVDLLPQP